VFAIALLRRSGLVLFGFVCRRSPIGGADAGSPPSIRGALSMRNRFLPPSAAVGCSARTIWGGRHAGHAWSARRPAQLSMIIGAWRSSRLNAVFGVLLGALGGLLHRRLDNALDAGRMTR
jgi:hypothetical protein